MPLSLSSAPSAPALDYESEVKSHLRLDTDEERFRLESVVIPAVTTWAESYTGRALVTQQWKLLLDTFPTVGSCIRLPKAPLQSVTYVKYIDTTGVQQTWPANKYIVQAPAGPYALSGRIEPVFGEFWPIARDQIGAVEILFTCGYGDNNQAVPALLRAALLLAAGEQFERRETAIAGTIISEVPMSARALAAPFKLMRFDA